MAVRTPVRQTLYTAIGFLVDRSAKVYAERTGRPLDGKMLIFVKEVILSMVDLIDEAYASGGRLDMKMIAKLAVARALALAGLTAEEQSWGDCAVATMSLAVATVDVFGIMVGAAGISSTGAGAVIGVPILLASGTFYAYQVSDMAQSCGDAYIAHAEAGFAAKHNITGRRQMMTNAGELMCRAPQ